MTPRQLESRLIDFAVAIIDVSEALPNSRAGNHIAGQLVRSGTSPAPNYGEAQAAESRKDFTHKLKICLKELRETLIWLRIIERKGYCGADMLGSAHSERNELVAIFVSSTKKTDSASPELLQKSKIKNPQS